MNVETLGTRTGDKSVGYADVGHQGHMTLSKMPVSPTRKFKIHSFSQEVNEGSKNKNAHKGGPCENRISRWASSSLSDALSINYL